MPLPKPQNGESQSEFVARCMRSLGDEFAGATQEQRAAVCYAQYRKAHKIAGVPGEAGMIALYPSPAVARQLAIQSNDGLVAESPDEIHLTLAYFPDAESFAPDIYRAAASASQYYGAAVGCVTGVAAFGADETNGTPIVLVIDSEPIRTLRDDVCWRLPYDSYSHKHSFLPHVTIGYRPGGDAAIPADAAEPGTEIVFGTLAVVIGGRRVDFTLAGGPVSYSETYRTVLGETDEKIDDVASRPETAPNDHPTAPQQKGVITEGKAGKRMGAGMLAKLEAAIDTLKNVFSWANYDGDDADNEGSKILKSFGDGSFVVLKAADGQLRWLATSSNAFVDRTGEIVSTKALEIDVEPCTPGGDYGPLRLIHVPGADVGKCDFRAMAGRFLVESGTFDSSPLAQAAIKYFLTTEDLLGMSIGFHYYEPDFDGTTYNRIKIYERSIAPLNLVANPLTSFAVTKGGVMNDVQERWLRSVVGDELANSIKSGSEEASKILEGVMAYKVAAPAENIEATTEPTEPVTTEAPTDETNSGASEGAPDETTKTVSLDAESFAEAMKAVLEPVTKALEVLPSMAEAIKAMHERVVAIETASAEKTAKVVDDTPRNISAYRASESVNNVLADGAALKATLGVPETVTNPVAGYLEDLVKAGR